MQFKDPFQLRMKFSMVFITLVVALIGISIPNALSHYIDPDSFEVGDCAEVHFTAPSTGLAALDMCDSNGNILLHVGYGVNWTNPRNNNLVTNMISLNTVTGEVRGTEQRITGVTSTSGTTLKFLVCAGANDFSITFNGKQVATYQYRINAAVTRLHYQNYGYDSTHSTVCYRNIAEQ